MKTCTTVTDENLAVMITFQTTHLAPGVSALHHKYKRDSRPSYHYNGNPYTWKGGLKYWDKDPDVMQDLAIASLINGMQSSRRWNSSIKLYTIQTAPRKIGDNCSVCIVDSVVYKPCHCFSAWLGYPRCVSNGDTRVLCKTIDINISNINIY